MKTMRTLSIIAAILAAHPAAAQAAEDVRSGGWGDLLRMLAGLAIVLGLLLLLYALARRGFGRLPGQRAGALKVVEMRHLGAKKALALVEVRGEELLLGVGADRIELLHRLEKRPGSDFEGTLARMENRP